MKKNYIKSALSIFVLFGATILMLSSQLEAKSTAKEIRVYASKSCGCCHKWVKHLESNGFKVKTTLMDDVYVMKEKLKVPDKLQSCHTAIVDGYVIEGHVPALAIKKLLSKKPTLKGIAAPGMPIGSPGMEDGNNKESYNVIGFGEKGEESIFMKF